MRIQNTSGKNKIIYLENEAKYKYKIPYQLCLLLEEAEANVGIDETIKYIEESLNIKIKWKK